MAVGGVGMPGRHLTGEQYLLDHTGLVFHVRVAVHRPGTDAAVTMALDAMLAEHGRNLPGVGNFVLGPRQVAEVDPATVSWRAGGGDGLAILELGERGQQ